MAAGGSQGGATPAQIGSARRLDLAEEVVDSPKASKSPTKTAKASPSKAREPGEADDLAFGDDFEVDADF